MFSTLFKALIELFRRYSGGSISRKNSFLEGYWNLYQSFTERNQIDVKHDPVTRSLFFHELYNTELGIVFGYYSVLKPNGELRFFIKDDSDNDNFNYDSIPVAPNYFVDETAFISSIELAKSTQSRLDGDQAPKSYQFFNYEPIPIGKLKYEHRDLVHRCYRNTLVQNLLLGYTFQVVLSEEVLFFVFAKFFSGVSNHGSPNLEEFLDFISVNVNDVVDGGEFVESSQSRQDFFSQNIRQLLKYACSVEALLLNNDADIKNGLNDWFSKRYSDYHLSAWGRKERNNDEFINRRRISQEVSRLNSREDVISFLKKVDLVVTSLVKGKKEDDDSEVDVIQRIARFDIDPSYEYIKQSKRKLAPDYFVFPMHRTSKESLFQKVKFPNYEDEQKVDAPVLFHSFVKSVFEITIDSGSEIQEDEKPETLFGFHLTQEICKQVAKPLVDNVFVSAVIEQELFKPQLKSAIAEIINRNYAHHIGSHVSHRAYFRKVLERMGWNLASLVNNKVDLATIGEMRTTLEKYKDERSEFVAGLTNRPVMLTADFYRDIILPFIENTLLTDNIAANEGIRYRNRAKEVQGISPTDTDKLDCPERSLSQLVIRVFLKSEDFRENRNDAEFRKLFDKEAKDKKRYRTDLVDVPDGYEEMRMVYYKDKKELQYDSVSLPYLRRVIDIEKGTFCDASKPTHSDIKITVPGPLGKHAMFSVLENFIRNSAKHGYDASSEEGEKPVEIHIKLEKDEDRSKIKLELTDTVSNKKLEEVVDSQRASIKAKVREKKALGMQDMKICTWLLADQDLEELDDDDKNPSMQVKDSEESKCLTYQFKLSKPKEVVVFSDSFRADQDCNEEGIFSFSIAELNEQRNCGFRFGILDCLGLPDNFEEQIRRLRHCLPMRLFLLNATPEQVEVGKIFGYANWKKGEIKDCANLIDTCWDEWVRHRLGGKEATLGVYFQQNSNEQPTSNWMSYNSRKQGRPFEVKTVADDNEAEKIDSEIAIIFDRHTELSKQVDGKSILNSGFYEAIGKGNADFDLLFAVNPVKTPRFPSQIVDAALLNILIVDERPAELVNQTVKDTQLKTFLFRQSKDSNKAVLGNASLNARVLIATSLHKQGKSNVSMTVSNKYDFEGSFSLNVTFAESNSGIDICLDDQRVEKNASRKPENKEDVPPWLKRKVDCVIIHRTILKKLMEDADWYKGLDFISRLNVSRVVVVTGGGEVEFLKNYKSVPVYPKSMLDAYVMKAYPSKLYLANYLN